MLLPLTACSGSGGSADQIKGQTPPPLRATLLPRRTGAPPDRARCLPTMTAGIFCSAGAVELLRRHTSGRTATCAPSRGCPDASRQAWVGNVNSAVLDGVLYATLDDAGSGAQLVRKRVRGKSPSWSSGTTPQIIISRTATLRHFSCGKATISYVHAASQSSRRTAGR